MKSSKMKSSDSINTNKILSDITLESVSSDHSQDFFADETVELDCEGKCLKNIHQIPKWYRNNNCIFYGYRPITGSIHRCLRSLFQIHNETGNIWSHLLGALMFIALYIRICFDPPFPQMGQDDFFLLSVFFFGMITCLAFSASFHTVTCYSKNAFRLFAKLDYCGITLLIGCSFVPWIYYAFYNSSIYQLFYISLSVLFAVICIVVSLFDRFSEPYYRKIRSVLFLCDGLSAFLPAIHWCMREIQYGESPFTSLNHQPGILLLIMGLSYVIGALFYLFKIPEQFFPGWFDLWFNSHQLFHVLVICGGLLYYHSFTQLMEIRLTNPQHFYN